MLEETGDTVFQETLTVYLRFVLFSSLLVSSLLFSSLLFSSLLFPSLPFPSLLFFSQWLLFLTHHNASELKQKCHFVKNLKIQCLSICNFSEWILGLLSQLPSSCLVTAYFPAFITSVITRNTDFRRKFVMLQRSITQQEYVIRIRIKFTQF